ncbi:anti-sigma factor antagonist [Synechocystis sp. FACHB-383]|uniref:Anti-sigma factor antagonist n=2 Tax=Synechocystis TaxID=1142 RepID=A0ABR9VW12_9SYNC|nr:anti-sigma factor antagonist [Synechocystis sp. FACHB-383]MBE9195696.1 anti-sigma factor antagonist [Synechocystis sp. LEGE 06083]MBE9242465.1 anti-sigma factor antagonist [Synechocystis salina LEGE 00041]MBE9255547.1 anti-sigma factor antagonist [Synechocystis salina LEGE 00031]
MMPFNPQVVARDVFYPQGTLSAAVTQAFQADLASWLATTSSPAVVIDFSQVDFLDSAILVVLVNAYKELQSQKRTLLLSGVSPELKIIFELTQLNRVFPIYSNPEAALVNGEKPAMAA